MNSDAQKNLLNRTNALEQELVSKNRELQIEASLEIVRARTMAMHKSTELAEIVKVLHNEMQTLYLNIDVLQIYENNGGPDFNVWISTTEINYPHQIKFPKFKHVLLDRFIKAHKEKESYFCLTLDRRSKNSFYRKYFNTANVETPIERQTELFERNSLMMAVSVNKHTDLAVVRFNDKIPEQEEINIIMRFGYVFEQAFTRFLDLQKAENQAREAQIEASLERVRARSLAMRQSEELLDVITEIFFQLEVLEITLDSCFINIYKDENPKDFAMYIAAGGNTYRDAVFVPFIKNPMFTRLLEARDNKQNFYSLLMYKKHIVTWWKQFFSNATNIEIPQKRRNLIANSPGIATSVSVGKYASIHVMRYVPTPYSDEENQIFMRFGKVFDQAYTRFLDLQKAEAQAKEAIKQASLDRVRGEIASMRSTEDLQRITPLVFNELTSLGVPFFRCGVFIINEKEKNLEVYLSAPDGHSLGILHLPFNVNQLTQNAVKNWKSKKVYHQHWNKKDFVAWTQSILAQGQIKDKKTYQGAATPPDSLDLHFIPFTQGMLYVGNTDPLDEDEIDLVGSLANAFSIAYARYEDFVNLDKANESIQTTLTELKATQNQLIQSEKMASLGELTAGIAHEIQNPLNFVNNFSEVSKELLEEMMEEMKKGDTEEVKAIADDVIQNLEKITHHGKRADGIVKGMLQHSRSSSGEKELTDINALADEYLRLAYHGLRAKDKSFNAKFETNFEEGLDRVNVIPQDIGRVVLNLITNAFYAVNERKKLDPNDYEPTVTLATKKEGDKMLIIVTDNGNGMPDSVKEKIFQPFFTTKPTGKGTGLGLSMSYDIVTKGHGGDFKVESEYGQGSTFTILLPNR